MPRKRGWRTRPFRWMPRKPLGVPDRANRRREISAGVPACDDGRRGIPPGVPRGLTSCRENWPGVPDWPVLCREMPTGVPHFELAQTVETIPQRLGAFCPVQRVAFLGNYTGWLVHPTGFLGVPIGDVVQPSAFLGGSTSCLVHQAGFLGIAQYAPGRHAPAQLWYYANHAPAGGELYESGAL